MRKKALCIGISYKTDLDWPGVLCGPHNDALRMSRTLRDVHGYTVEILLDLEPYIEPTKSNIKAAISRLVEGAQEGDRLFFHFSGHGDQIPNLDGTEDDGKDEVILPSDWELDPSHPDMDDRERYTVDGRIVDDELHEWLVKPIPPGCYLNALLDNCHSGTALDLEHRRYCRGLEADYTLPGSPITETIYEEPDSLSSPLERQAPLIQKLRIGSHKNSLGIEGAAEISYSVMPETNFRRNSKCKSSMNRGRLIVRGETDDRSPISQGGNVYSWCACSDAQIAGESEGERATGYMVDAFLKCLEENPTPTYEQLLVALCERLQALCHTYNTKGRRASAELVFQEPELGSHLRPDMKATFVI